MSSLQSKRVVIIGGGITGLSAAFYAQQQARQHKQELEIVLLEESARIGGKIQTIRRDGFVIEAGPDSFLQRKQPIMDLTKELQLENKLVGLNPKSKGASIVHNGELHPIPAGFVLGIPTLWEPLLNTKLLSHKGKVRAVLDLFLPDRSPEGDEALGQFLKRRLGSEVADYVAEPLLSGIYAGDTDKLSLLATFPEFRALEKKYGSVIRGMRLSRKPKPDATHNAPIQQLPEPTKKSMFLSYRNGLSTLIERLEEVLTGVDIRLNTAVETVQSDGGIHHVQLKNGETITADSVIITTPTYVTKKILSDYEPIQALEKIPYVSVANVVLAFNAEDINVPLDGNGFVIPRTEHKNITASTWTSTKWPHTAPEGKALIRCYVGHEGDQRTPFLPDEELVAAVKSDLNNLMGLNAEPIFYEVTRLYHSMPQYLVGHRDTINSVRSSLAADRPGIIVTGAAFEGVGIPDCIRQGKDSALEALELFNKQ